MRLRHTSSTIPIALATILVGTWLPAQDPPVVTQDVVYGHKDGMALTFDVFRPQQAANGAGVIYILSTGFRSPWMTPEDLLRNVPGVVDLAIIPVLLESGFTVFVVRHGSSPRYKVPDALADVDRAVRYIRLQAADFGVDAERLGVYGGSAGGILALMSGLDADAGNLDAEDEVLRAPSGVAAVVAAAITGDLRPVAGLAELHPAFDFPAELGPSVSPILFVTPDDPPILLIHGDADETVPIQRSELMHEALQAAGVTSELLRISGGDHSLSLPEHAPLVIEATVAWFERFLLPG